MIIYAATKKEFAKDVNSNQIEKKILKEFESKIGGVAQPEITAWRNSLMYMNNAISDPEIADDVSVGIEYRIPGTSKRIDFILAGLDENKSEKLVVVELKQWSEIEMTEKDALVKTVVGRGWHERPHPSYQAWTYAQLLRDFNSTVQDEKIQIYPCAYLHNCEDPTVVDEFYRPHLERAPLFLRSDAERLTAFIKRHVRHSDRRGLLYRIDQGKIQPSKHLADTLASMLKGNQEFLMIDDQKIVYENALAMAKDATAKEKKVLIVHGGPGSGKSVVAINLLVEFTNRKMTTQYVTKNAAPRAVYHQKLTGTMKRTHIENLFVGSGAFTEAEKNTFDALVVDEAHRLNEKSGLFQNLGENQIKELIHSSRFTVFFLDESQRVTFKDIGSREEILKWAKKLGAEVKELNLSSQFRCAGSDAYLAWLDHTLQIKETANQSLTDTSYEFRVFDSPTEMHEAIAEKNDVNNKSRVVAGYCWDWKSKTDPKAYDIEIGKYKRRWNLTSDGSGWIIQPTSINEVGCIHTCQGLEVEYVGVIIGEDLVVRNGKVLTDALKRSTNDQSIKGYRGMLKEDPRAAREMAESVIKNTYRTLMTRGMKGCYVYCVDSETREYFKACLARK